MALSCWFFDGSSVLYKKRNGQSAGLEARLRFSSYDRRFLEQIKGFVKGGSITEEAHSKGLYYRLTVTDYYRIESILTHLIPVLIRKRLIVERWLLLHKANAELGRLKRSVRLKPRKFVGSEVRRLGRQMDQLGLPPLGAPIRPLPRAKNNRFRRPMKASGMARRSFAEPAEIP